MRGAYRLIQEDTCTLVVQVVGRLTPDIARVMLDHARSYAAQSGSRMTTMIDLTYAKPVSAAVPVCLLALLQVESHSVEAIFGVSPVQRVLMSLSLKMSRVAHQCRCFADEHSARQWVAHQQAWH